MPLAKPIQAAAPLRAVETIPVPAPSPCSNCKDYRKQIRELTAEMGQWQMEVERLRRALLRESHHIEGGRYHGKNARGY